MLHHYFIIKRTASNAVRWPATHEEPLDKFPHSRIAEVNLKKNFKERLPPFLQDNEGLQCKFVHIAHRRLKKYVAKSIYGLSEAPVRSTIWEWLTFLLTSQKNM